MARKHNQTTVYLTDGQDKAAEELVRQSYRSDDVPEMSKSEVLRAVFDAGLDARDDLRDLLPEHAAMRYQRDRFKEGEGWKRNMQTGFEARVKSHFKTRFEDGIREDLVDEWAENMRTEARIVFPDDEERRAEAKSYVDDLAAACEEAIRTSTYDPLDPETVFGHYQGVEEGNQHADKLPEMIEDATDALRPKRLENSGAVVDDGDDPDEVAMRLSRRYSVPVDVAETAVDRAASILDGGESDD
jgi:hypothetical protein